MARGNSVDTFEVLGGLQPMKQKQQSSDRPKLIFVITEDWFFCSHFLERGIATSKSGFDIVVAGNANQHATTITAAGLRYVPVDFARGSLNPFTLFAILCKLVRLYSEERASIVHHIALKPILLGTIAARFAGVQNVVNAPVGMGFVFASSSVKARLLRPLVQLALRFLMNPAGSKVIFENSDDLNEHVKAEQVRIKDAVLIRGAGVDLSLYERPRTVRQRPIVLLAARLLVSKGIREFVQAASILREQGAQAEYWLAGAIDEQNPDSIHHHEIADWTRSGLVKWLGFRSDMPELLASVDIACLPSFYREGLPKSLIEALAASLPVVTTDTVGCREVVTHGYNGLLVPPRDATALASALHQLIENPALRQKMGTCGRLRAEQEFSSERVIHETLAVYNGLLHRRMNGQGVQ